MHALKSWQLKLLKLLQLLEWLLTLTATSWWVFYLPQPLVPCYSA